MPRPRMRTIAADLAMVCCLLSGCGSVKTSEIKPEARLRIAQAAETSGDFGLARSMYVTAATEAWNDREIQMRAAEGLSRSGAPADAMALLDAGVKRAPSDVDMRRTLASLQIINGNPGEAAGNLSAVLAARPNDDTARLNLGVAMDMLNRHAEAQVLYRSILARAPFDTEAANDLALSLMLSGQQREARTVLVPFRDRADVPDRLRTTMQLVDGVAGTTADPRSATMSRAPGDVPGAAPIPLTAPGVTAAPAPRR